MIPKYKLPVGITMDHCRKGIQLLSDRGYVDLFERHMEQVVSWVRPSWSQAERDGRVKCHREGCVAGKMLLEANNGVIFTAPLGDHWVGMCYFCDDNLMREMPQGFKELLTILSESEKFNTGLAYSSYAAARKAIPSLLNNYGEILTEDIKEEILTLLEITRTKFLADLMGNLHQSAAVALAVERVTERQKAVKNGPYSEDPGFPEFWGMLKTEGGGFDLDLYAQKWNTSAHGLEYRKRCVRKLERLLDAAHAQALADTEPALISFFRGELDYPLDDILAEVVLGFGKKSTEGHYMVVPAPVGHFFHRQLGGGQLYGAVLETDTEGIWETAVQLCMEATSPELADPQNALDAARKL